MANFCKYCGGAIDSDSIFCAHCGANLTGTISPAQAEQKPAVEPTPEATYPQPQPAPQPAPEATYSDPQPVVQPTHEATYSDPQPVAQPAPEVTYPQPQPIPPAPDTTAWHQTAFTDQCAPIDNSRKAEKKRKKPKKKKGLIIGIIAGAAALIAAAVFVFFFLIPSLPREYVLMSYDMGGDKYNDFILLSLGNESEFPAYLTVKGNTGEVTDQHGKPYARIEFEAGKTKGTYTYTGAENSEKVDVVIKDDDLVITKKGSKIQYRKKGKAASLDLSGDFLIEDVCEDSGSHLNDYFYNCIKSKTDPATSLSLEKSEKNTYKGTILSADEKEFAKLTLDADTMGGTIQYAAKNGCEVFVCAEENTLKIYAENEGVLYDFVRPGAIDLSSVKGDYVFEKGYDTRCEDLMSYWKNEGYLIPETLTLNDDGKASICYTAGERFADLSIDPKTMSGTIKYTGMNEPAKCFVSVKGDAVTFYDFDVGTYYTYSKPEPLDLTEEAGHYVVTQSADLKHKDFLEELELTNKLLPTRMDLNADGTGSIVDEGGDLFASFAIHPGGLSADFTFTNAGIEDTAGVTIGNDTVRFECSTGYLFVFQKPSAIDLSDASGSFALIGFKNKDKTDYNAYGVVHSKKVVCQMTLDANGKGKILYTDGKAHGTFTLDRETMSAKMTEPHTGKSYKLFMTVKDKTAKVYAGKLVFTFTRDAKQRVKDNAGSGKLKSVKIQNNKTPKTPFIKVSLDGITGEIKLIVSGSKIKYKNIRERIKYLTSHQTQVLKGKIDFSNMTVTFSRNKYSKIAKNYKPFKAFVAISGKTLKLYDYGNRTLYQYSLE